MNVGMWALELSESAIDVKTLNILTQSCLALRKHSLQKATLLFQSEILKIPT